MDLYTCSNQAFKYQLAAFCLFNARIGNVTRAYPSISLLCKYSILALKVLGPISPNIDFFQAIPQV
jgi:hypothetical protein